MITLTEQIAEAQRELALRRTCYPRWVEQGRLTHDEAYHQLAAMTAIVATLKRLDATAGQLGLFPVS